MNHDKRLEELIDKINKYAEFLTDHAAPDVASKLREIVGGKSKKWDDADLADMIKSGTEAYDRELAARGSQPRVVNVVVAVLDWLSDFECTWESIDLEDLATDIEEKYK